ncbi:hypothetical protein, partial [Enterobacter sp. Bisph1]|uniref:hypothetical protein n=1 Tax=Enterobacter sp. Bisph1 TaxID=1274399 RepID=UPI001E54A42D
FEVDDGRFTVCSLWPLGNPTTGYNAFMMCSHLLFGNINTKLNALLLAASISGSAAHHIK